MLTPFREWAETSSAMHVDSIKASCAELVIGSGRFVGP